MTEPWFRDTAEELSRINITPLVDVALVLLIIFMITAPMMVQGAQVRLPETRPMDSLPPEALILTVDAEERIFLNDERVELDDLVARLSPLASRSRTLHLRADGSLTYETVMQVMERLTRAGPFDIGLVIQPLIERSSGGGQ